MLEQGIHTIYVFDGKPPELKIYEIEKRKKAREEAYKKLMEAKERGDIEEMRRFAQASSRLTDEMVRESKRLLEYMGIPYVQAPSEGEAQAAWMTINNIVYATGSQDYDSIIFGSPRLIRNLTVSGKRKLPKKDIYIEVSPEEITLEKVMGKLKISREQLVDIAILIGTDYNPGGVKGIGPKRAYEIIKKYGKIEEAIRAGIIKKEELAGIDLDEIRKIFLEPPHIDVANLDFKDVNEEGIKKLLVEEHDFNLDRVEQGISRLKKGYKGIGKGARSYGLDKWL